MSPPFMGGSLRCAENAPLTPKDQSRASPSADERCAQPLGGSENESFHQIFPSGRRSGALSCRFACQCSTSCERACWRAFARGAVEPARASSLSRLSLSRPWRPIRIPPLSLGTRVLDRPVGLSPLRFRPPLPLASLVIAENRARSLCGDSGPSMCDADGRF